MRGAGVRGLRGAAVCRENSVAGYGIPFIYGWVAGLPGPLICVGGTPSMAPHQSLRPASHRPLFEGVHENHFAAQRGCLHVPGTGFCSGGAPPGPKLGSVIGWQNTELRSRGPRTAGRGHRQICPRTNSCLLLPSFGHPPRLFAVQFGRFRQKPHRAGLVSPRRR